MISRVRPSNCTDLLIEAVASARRSRFWRRKLGDWPVRSQADFNRLPFTSVGEYRGQSFASVVAKPDGIEWIQGSWLGQSPDHVPVAEGPTEAKVRVELLTDAIRPVLPSFHPHPGGEGSDRGGRSPSPSRERVKIYASRKGGNGSSALVVATRERRHFGAETCAALVRMGVQAHLAIDTATDRLEGLIRAFEPDVVVALSPAVDPVSSTGQALNALPDSITGVVTVGRGSPIAGLRHVDLCVQNELGVLGAAFGSDRYESNKYEMNHHRFHFEKSPMGTLAATPYFSRVQPLIRLDTGMPAPVERE